MKSIFSSSSAKALHGGLNLSNLLTLHISVPMVIRIERRINDKQRVSVKLTPTSDALLHIHLYYFFAVKFENEYHEKLWFDLKHEMKYTKSINVLDQWHMGTIHLPFLGPGLVKQGWLIPKKCYKRECIPTQSKNMAWVLTRECVAKKVVFIKDLWLPRQRSCPPPCPLQPTCPSLRCLTRSCI